MTDRDLLMAKVTASLNREYSGKKLLDHRPRKNRLKRVWIFILAFIGGLYNLMYGYFSNHLRYGALLSFLATSACIGAIVAVTAYKEQIEAFFTNPWNQLYFTLGLISIVAGWWLVRYFKNKH